MSLSKTLLIIPLALLAAILPATTHAAPQKGAMPVVTIPNDSLTVLYGNSLINRLQEEGTFEAYIHASPFKESGHKNQFRSMAYVGDQVHFRIRPEKFGSHKAYLVNQWKADQVIMAFGGNEAQRGPDGLAAFKEQLNSYLDIIAERHTCKHYVLCSPIAAENNSRILDLRVAERNEDLKLYSDAIADAAKARKMTFVDLFSPTKSLFQGTDGKYTVDGLHLNELGAGKVGQFLAQGLLGAKANAVDSTSPGFLALKNLVSRKAYEVAQCYHPSNGISYYGTRARDYEYTAEIPHHLKLANQLDQAIWKQASNLKQALPFPKLPVLKVEMPSKKPRNGLGIIKPSQDDLKDFTVADGFALNCFASSEDFPELINPLQMQFDAKGRLWVTCFASYPHPLPGAVAHDFILILEDTDNDGKADKKTVFADKLLLPDGFVLYKKGALVSVSRKIIYLEDTDGDDIADVREEFLRGFDNTDTHHSGYLSRSPRGDLILSEALFHRGQFETLNGVVHTKDTSIMSLDLDTRRLTVERQTEAPNPWRVAYNSVGEAIQFYGGGQIIDADIHNIHTPMGASAPTALGYPFRYDKGCSAEFVESPHFPQDWQGGYLTSHLLRTNEINYTALKYVDGAIKADGNKITLLSSRNKIFRPSDLIFGTDGALYISDFYYPIIGHAQHSNRDKNRDYANGRVWRLTQKNTPLVDPPKIAGASTKELIALLKHPHLKIRQLARLELETHPRPDVLAETKSIQVFITGRDNFSLEILWLLERLKAFEDPSVFWKNLSSNNINNSRAAVRSIRWWAPTLGAELTTIAEKIATHQDERIKILLVGVLSHLQLQDDKWSAVIATIPAKEKTPLAYAKTMASWKDRPSIAPQFPLLKISPDAYLSKTSFTGDPTKKATLYFKSETETELIIGHSGNPYLNISLNDKPILITSGSPHTATSQNTIAVNKGINKVEITVTPGKVRRSPKNQAIYLCTKAGSKPETISLAKSEAQRENWIAQYDKQLEFNWESFARATFQTHCANCHAVESKAVGPALKGLFGKTQTVIFADGSKKEVTVDHNYLHDALRKPMSAYPEGYLPAMPPLPLSDKEIEILIRWIKNM
ncbi:MAG: GDSL-type esterase/lipase family protein [Akkermansiaceae bacterium]